MKEDAPIAAPVSDGAADTSAGHGEPPCAGTGDVSVREAASESASAGNGSVPDPEEGGAAAPGSVSPDAGEATSVQGGGGESGFRGAAGADGEEDENKGKKRKRRRRRKKGTVSQPSETGPLKGSVSRPPETGTKQASKAAPAAAPLARFLGPTGRRHAFAVGEIIAGRVVTTQAGTVVVDLFGKATAIMDEREPREPPDPQLQSSAPAASAGGVGTGGSEPPAGSDVASSPAQQAASESEHPSRAQAEQSPALDTEASAEESSATRADEAAIAQAGQVPAAQPDQGIGAPPEPGSVEHEGAASASGDAPGKPAAGMLPAEAGPTPEALTAEIGAPAEIGATSETGATSEGAAADAAPAAGPAADPPAIDAEQILADLMLVGEQGPPLEPGDIVRGRVGAVAENGHIAIVNRVVDPAHVKAAFELLRDQRRRVDGVVFGFNRGGYDVLVLGVRAFCPASGMSLEHVGDPNEFLGRRLDFVLPVAKGASDDIVVSRRSILEREQRKRAKQLLRSLRSGQRLKGRVTQVRDFGLFVDVGGVEGLVHQSELSFDRSVRPADAAQVGDEVDVEVLKVGSDAPNKRDRNRVSLSIKATLPHPWDEHPQLLVEGSLAEGTVKRLTDFGAFVELAPSVEGLLHLSELGRDLKHASQSLELAQKLDVIIERVDRQSHRISLSKPTPGELKDYRGGAIAGESRPPSLRPGTSVGVKVERVDSRGLHVRVLGMIGKRARALIPHKELGPDAGDLKKTSPPGTELEVKIVGSDRDRGLRLSRKAQLADEERRAVKEYRREVSKQGLGTFGDLLRAKLGGR
ncbi:MAG: S1 RNA-binding domain-containing protein [Proteobacteria bacterium]|nr:S1 RNA-binding domain-containing protein [Pseudomonadota bacterium]